MIWMHGASRRQESRRRSQESWIEDLESNKHVSRSILPENIAAFRRGCGVFLLGSQILLLAADTLGVSVVWFKARGKLFAASGLALIE